MDRPKIVVHMMSSLDGKTVGDFMYEGPELAGYYNNLTENFKSNVLLMGSNTIKEAYTSENTLELDNDVPKIDREDFVVNKNDVNYLIVVDPSGDLAWNEYNFSTENEYRVREQVIVILTKSVSDAYLHHLQNLGIGYVFGGEKTIDLNKVVVRLKELYSFQTIVVEGGGTINGFFLNEGLVDVFSLMLVPIVDGTARSKSAFDIDAEIRKNKFVKFDLNQVEKIEDGCLWLTYNVKSK